MSQIQALTPFLWPFGLALVVVLALTPLIGRLARRRGYVAHPGRDRWHRESVPLLGGVGIFVATLVGALLFGEVGPTILTTLAAGGVMFVVGLVDDLVHLKPSTKLTAQVAVACVVVFSGFMLPWSTVGTVNVLLTILWFVGITNAFNLLDNMDGLCAGIVAIACVGFTLSVGAAVPTAVVSAALAGAAAGFLWFNFKPASIFMGDAGSLFVGATLATLALADDPLDRAGLVSTVSVPVLLLLIPILDTAFVTLTRKLSARAASVGGQDHTSHRLVALGFSERQAVLLLYALAAVGGTIAVRVSNGGSEGVLLMALLAVGITLLAIQLARVRVYDGEDFSVLRDKSYTPLLVDFTYRRRVFEVLLDVGLITIAYYAAYVIRFDEAIEIYRDQITTSLPIIIAVQLLSFFAVGIYRGVWRYVSADDLMTYVRGLLGGVVLNVIAIVYLYRFEQYSRSVFVIYAMTLALLVVGSRLSFRLLADVAGKYRRAGKPALIYGAGDGGALLVRELRNNASLGLSLVGFIDDDPSKLQRRILRVPVLGDITSLPAVVAQHRIEVVIVSTAKLGARQRAQLERTCFASGTTLLEMDFALRRVTPSAPPLGTGGTR